MLTTTTASLAICCIIFYAFAKTLIAIHRKGHNLFYKETFRPAHPDQSYEDYCLFYWLVIIFTLLSGGGIVVTLSLMLKFGL